MSRLFAPPRVVFLTIFTVGMVAIAGCGGDRTPISAASSKYEVADDSETSSTVDSETSSTVDSGLPSNPPTQPPTVAPIGALQPASDSPQDLMAYVAKLGQAGPSGTTQAEVIADMQRIQSQIVDVCERVLKMDAPEEVKLAAAHSELAAFSQMLSMGDATAAKRIEEFVARMNASDDEVLQRMGFEVGFADRMNSLRMGNDVDPLTAMKDLRHLLTIRDKDFQLLQIGNDVAAILDEAGHPKQAIDAFRLMADAFKDVEDAGLREAAAGLNDRARLLESDITTLLGDMLEGNEEANAKFVKAAQELLEAEGAGFVTLDYFQQVAPRLEIDKPEVARELYTAFSTAFKTNSNTELAKLALQTYESYYKRSAIVGNPFTVEGNDLRGEKFEWAQYKDKIVLVDFWATWCGPCLEEMPNIRENYDRYHDQGFEVVGVNLDEDMQSLHNFIEFHKLPWTSVLAADPRMRGWSHPMIEKCGVTSLPFLVLVGRDGIALATNIRGDALDEKLAELFPAGDTPPVPGDAKAAPASKAKPATTTESEPATSEEAPDSDPAAPTPAPEPAATTPGADGTSTGGLQHRYRGVPRENGFVGFTVPGDSPTGAPQRSNAVVPVADTDGDEEPNPDEESEVNPYSPPSGLSPRQLVDFIFSMQEKPLSIQRRPGFADAIAEAADQVLAANASDQLQIVAVEAKFEVLHKAASLGNDQADRQLDEFVNQMQDDERERIAKQVRFFKLERKALGADEIALAAVPGLLDELKAYFDKQKLTEKHLRLASATVHAINRLTDGTVREEYFKQFGSKFATSKDKDLARYGRKIGKSPTQPVSKLVGKSLELNGITILGTDFDWEAYRGKVVVVDFWATWCGPCRRETPHLKALSKTSDKLAIVAVSLDQDIEAVEKYLDENEIEWANLVGNEAMQIANKYGIRAIPTMLVIDAEGKIVAVGNSVSQIQPKVQQLLAG
jgi:thiol-disulfide isomerase/thioredoxin